METESTKNASPTELRIYDDGKVKLMYAPVWVLLLNEVTKPNLGTLAGDTPPVSKSEAIKLVNQLDILDEPLKRSRVETALRRYGDLAWFERFLLLGANPPGDIHVLTIEQVQAIDATLDYTAHMANAVRIDAKQKRDHAGPYRDWFEHNVWRARSLDEWYERVLWLLSGITPSGVYVIERNITQLRQAESQYGRIARARCGSRSLVRWRASEKDRRALDVAIECCKNGYPLSWLDDQSAWVAAAGDQLSKDNAGTRGTSKAWLQKKRDSLLRFANTYHRPSTLAALSPPLTPDQWNNEKQKCCDILNLTADQGDPLEEYATGQLPKRPKHLKQGMIRAGMFVPFALMWNFRDVASNAWSQNKMGEIAKTPGFRYLFLDRVLPRRLRSKKCLAREKLQAAVTIYSGRTEGTKVSLRNWRRVRLPLDRIVKRNQAIVVAYQNGEHDSAVLATQFGVSRGTIRAVTAPLRTYDGRPRGRRDPSVAERHRAIAADFRQGDKDIAELAKRHGVTKGAVWKATRHLRQLNHVEQLPNDEAQPRAAVGDSTISTLKSKNTKDRKGKANKRGRDHASDQHKKDAQLVIEYFCANRQLKPIVIARRLGLDSKFTRNTISNFNRSQKDKPNS